MRSIVFLLGIFFVICGEISSTSSNKDNVFIDQVSLSVAVAKGESFAIHCVTPWIGLMNAWKKNDVVIPSGSRYTMKSVRLRNEDVAKLMENQAKLRERQSRIALNMLKYDPLERLQLLTGQKLELWTLNIKNIDVDDMGNYSCGGEARTYFELKMKSLRERVYAESEILTNENRTEYGVPGVIVNPKSQRLILKCNYTGDSYKGGDQPTYSYVWYKDDVALKENSKYHFKVEGSASILTVEGCDVEDAGNYSCKLNNDEQATLRVLMYPTMEHVERSKNQVQGDPLTLLCKVRGYPTPTVTWKKGDADLELDERMELLPIDGVKDAKLVIKDLQYEDKGKYVCLATSLNVTRSVDITVRVKDKYAALWPFLGICAEVAILCTIIFIFEKRRTKPEFDEDDDKKESSSHRK